VLGHIRPYTVAAAAVCLAVWSGACAEDLGVRGAAEGDGPLAECVKAEGQPFPTSEVKEALTAQGFSVFSDRDCAGAADIHVILTNSDGVGAPPAGEGYLGCAVRTRPLWGDRIRRKGPEDLPGREKVSVTYANVDCQLTLEDLDQDEKLRQTERLLAAMRQLQVTSR
jgi:hypothetical protein